MTIATLTTTLAGLLAGVGGLGLVLVGLIMASGPVGHDYIVERRGLVMRIFAGLAIGASAAYLVSLIIPAQG